MTRRRRKPASDSENGATRRTSRYGAQFTDGQPTTITVPLNLTDNVPGNVPPIDGMAVATRGRGTLYVVDNKAGTITALQTRGWPGGTVFVGEPNDNGNPLIGTLSLSTGQITPLGNTFVSPKGLLFLPSGE